jgi:hypothetical protein
MFTPDPRVNVGPAKVRKSFVVIFNSCLNLQVRLQLHIYSFLFYSTLLRPYPQRNLTGGNPRILSLFPLPTFIVFFSCRPAQPANPVTPRTPLSYRASASHTGTPQPLVLSRSHAHFFFFLPSKPADELSNPATTRHHGIWWCIPRPVHLGRDRGHSSPSPVADQPRSVEPKPELGPSNQSPPSRQDLCVLRRLAGEIAWWASAPQALCGQS